MRDLRRAFNQSWEQAKAHDGDFQDCLLHYLSENLGMPVLNEIQGGPERYTDGGIVEGCVPSTEASGLKNETHAD